MTAVIDRPTPDAPAPPPEQRSSPDWVVACGLVLIGQVLVLADLDVPVLRPVVGLVVLVGVPILVLQRRVSWQVEHAAVALVYAVTTAVLGVLLVALAINTALPAVGIDRPLDRPVLVVCSTIIDLALLSWRASVPLVQPGLLRRLARAALHSRLEPAVTVAVLSLTLAVTGAIRLNNGAGGGVATVAHAAAVVALAFLLFRPGSLGRDAVVLYVVSVALLLGTSLRGWYITGHDIQREYIAYLLTHDAGHWQMDRYQSAYNACLSVNILPSVLAEMTGMSGTHVFKVVLQLLFAGVPVVVYLFSRRLVEHRLAIMGTALFVVFPTFFSDMPYLVRQEVAFVFLAAALLAATQTRWSIRTRRVVVSAFAVGVVLSHYSTTYLLLIGLLVGSAGAAVGAALRWVHARRHPGGMHATRTKLVLLSPVVVVTVLAATWLWTNPATDSGGHFAETVVETSSTLFRGGDAESSSDVSYGLFSGSQATPQERFDQYVDESLAERRDGATDRVLADPTPAESRPELVDRDVLPLTSLGRALTDAGISAQSVNTGLRALSAALFQVFLLIGVFVLVLRRGGAKRVGPEAFWLAGGALAALGVVVVIPGLSAEYGVLRAFQQTLIVAAPVAAIGAVACLRPLRSKAVAAASAVVLAMGLSLTGAQPALLGGYEAQLSQDNSGLYYDLHYLSAAEVSAARWLGSSVEGSPVQSEVISDKVAVSRLQAVVPRHVRVSGEFFPLALRKGSYVFLGTETVKRDRATIFFTGDLLTYRYPTEVLDTRLNLVYSNPNARIYR